MSLMDLIRGRKKKGETSAGTAKKRLMDLCIYHTGLDGDDAEQLIARIREAVLKILSEHFNAEIGMDNVSTNLKKEKLADSMFHFNSKDFPTAEVIDLR